MTLPTCSGGHTSSLGAQTCDVCGEKLGAPATERPNSGALMVTVAVLLAVFGAMATDEYPIGLWAMSGLLFLSGVVLLANHRTTPTNDADTRPCPFCAEDIKQAASVCRYCLRDVNPA